MWILLLVLALAVLYVLTAFLLDLPLPGARRASLDDDLPAPPYTGRGGPPRKHRK